MKKLVKILAALAVALVGFAFVSCADNAVALPEGMEFAEIIKDFSFAEADFTPNPQDLNGDGDEEDTIVVYRNSATSKYSLDLIDWYTAEEVEEEFGFVLTYDGTKLTLTVPSV
ncbi:MAG: hypothetical protein J6Y60_13985 [Treponema sp.]|nr:hypothetical protein [Treponema sp.]